MSTTTAAALIVVVTSAALTPAFADDRDGHGYVHHAEWRKGARIQDADWKRGEQVDYRQHHLRAPPHGYEWRMVDGNYVLAAVATGVIASVIVASAAGH